MELTASCRSACVETLYTDVGVGSGVGNAVADGAAVGITLGVDGIRVAVGIGEGFGLRHSLNPPACPHPSDVNSITSPTSTAAPSGPVVFVYGTPEKSGEDRMNKTPKYVTLQ